MILSSQDFFAYVMKLCGLYIPKWYYNSDDVVHHVVDTIILSQALMFLRNLRLQWSKAPPLTWLNLNLTLFRLQLSSAIKVSVKFLYYPSTFSVFEKYKNKK